MNFENSQPQISAVLKVHEEWLLIDSASGKHFALRQSEIEIESGRGKTMFGFFDENGFQTWRVENWTNEDGKIHLDLTRNFGKENKKIRLVPRTAAGELALFVELARQEKAQQIANLLVENYPQIKLFRVSLNQESGRFANIIFELAAGKHIAALADVSGEATPEKLLTTAILWIEKLQSRKKNSVEKIWIIAQRKSASELQKIRALLRSNWQSKIEICELSGKAEIGQPSIIEKLETISFNDLWREKPKKIQEIKLAEMSEMARKIIKLAPAEIDVIRSKHGETLRFSGLAFARVRKIFGEEKAWFGTGAKRQILNDKSSPELLKLIGDLKIYRRSDSANKRHAFYSSSPENWLESLLRKNVRQIDANLMLSPVYNQFRVATGDKLDLLALRCDGRLVVIELKTSPDREMVFQVADYWRKVELHRRAGNIQKNRIFGDAQISDQPALVYAVAPMLSFHRDFDFFARMIAPEIEIARFDLNENWRENLRVVRRELRNHKGFTENYENDF